MVQELFNAKPDMPLSMVDFQFVYCSALRLGFSCVGNFGSKFILLAINDGDLFSDAAWSGVSYHTRSGLNLLVYLQFIHHSTLELHLYFVASFKIKFSCDVRLLVARR